MSCGELEVCRINQKSILSIDGSGMRGILACCYLSYLQNALKLKMGNPNAHVSDYFDIAAGTNIGGIIIVALLAKGEDNRALHTAQETMDFIIGKGKQMFQLSSSCGFLGKLILRIKVAAANPYGIPILCTVGGR
jgi:patatin-like phospholipase/acyl hydrolase